MKTLRKIIPLLLLTSSLASCSYGSVKPGPMKNLVGTYELVEYKMKHSQDDEDTYDRKAEIGAVAYFSIAEDGYSYYVYKDNNTAPKFSTMFGLFDFNSPDDDHPDYVRSVRIRDGVTHKYENEMYVGCGAEPTMHFRNDTFSKKLHYTLSGHMAFQPDNIIPYQYVQYKRVSTEASLNKVNELMGTSFTVNVPFECKALKGYLVYRCNVNDGSSLPKDGKGLYEYAILDTTSYASGSYTIYYSLKSDPGMQTLRVPVTVETKGFSFSISFQNRKFYGSDTYEKMATTLGTKYDEYPEGSEINSESFTAWYGSDASLEYVIEQETAYNGIF